MTDRAVNAWAWLLSVAALAALAGLTAVYRKTLRTSMPPRSCVGGASSSGVSYVWTRTR